VSAAARVAEVAHLHVLRPGLTLRRGIPGLRDVTVCPRSDARHDGFCAAPLVANAIDMVGRQRIVGAPVALHGCIFVTAEAA
jgi:hypothetical protein